MITLEPVSYHRTNKEYLENHTRWRNESLAWLRENKTTTVEQQHLFFLTQPQDQEFFCIVQNSVIKGTCGLTDIRTSHGTAEFSLLVGSEFQQQGIGTKALRTLLEYGFNKLHLHLIYGETFVYPAPIGINPGAKAYEKLGFIKEARLKDRYIKNGQKVDSVIYSITSEEFFERERLERVSDTSKS